jgi:hypothetical protein
MKKRENKTKQKTEEWFGSTATVTLREQSGKTGV